MANRPAVRPGSSRVRRRVEWIAAHSPRTKGRIERLFGTVQDRLVREMRIQQIASLEQGNRFLELTFWPLLALRFTRQSTTAVNAHRPLERTQHLEGILSVRQTRTVAADNTVSWQDQRWGLWREDVCAGLRGARVEIGCGSATSANRPDTVRYLPLHACPAAPPLATPCGLRPGGVADAKIKAPPQIKTNCIRSRSSLEETLGADISIRQKTGHFYVALTVQP